MRSTNFTSCALRYVDAHNQTLIDKYGWTGPIRGINRNTSTQISTAGCIALCGDGNDYYDWSQSSNTITTWVLPVIGMLLQAPFVSNAFWQTLYALARWIGSPMASISYILWNIKVSGKCALMVDMAIPYGKAIPDQDSDFGSIRDSFYILMTMNQYRMKQRAVQKKESEGLLRIALFSKDLRLLKPSNDISRSGSVAGSPQLGSSTGLGINTCTANTLRPHTTHAPTPPQTELEPPGKLNELRQEIAQSMREGRKRGVVPVFISTMWFLFSLAISIQSAFGLLGSNATAHDLALGCLLSWLPVLIMCSIIDRNPVSSDDIRKKLNELVDRVRLSLMDTWIMEDFIHSIDQNQRQEMRTWIEHISLSCASMENLFVDFAGQGRVRWHYGAAHPILSDIEEVYVAAEGRDWLHHEEEARTKLVLGRSYEGLNWFDYRELWQIFSSVLIVGSTCGGAFVLSYFTPTVGLGCRSGGYTIFASISFGLLVLEMLMWWCMDANKPQIREFQRRMTNNGTFTSWQTLSLFARRAGKGISNLFSSAFQIFLKALGLMVSHARIDKIERAANRYWDSWQDRTVQEKSELLFFVPAEIINTIWLIYICLAQTVGSYNNCNCFTSRWGGGGGYIDFTQYSTTNSPWVMLYWTSGTILSTLVMGVAMIYVVLEWCLQSHLSTANYDSAKRGLRRTQQFRRATYGYRIAVNGLVEAAYMVRRGINAILRVLRIVKATEKPRESRRSLIWTTSITCTDPEHDHTLSYSHGMQPLEEMRHGRSSSHSPLLTRQDTDGGPSVVIDPDSVAGSSYRRSNDDSPRSSWDVSPATPNTFLQAGQRPTYERQGTDSPGGS